MRRIRGAAYTVGDEKDRDRKLELITSQTQIFFHAEQTGIAYID
jgi:hypothetical protein